MCISMRAVDDHKYYTAIISKYILKQSTPIFMKLGMSDTEFIQRKIAEKSRMIAKGVDYMNILKLFIQSNQIKFI